MGVNLYHLPPEKIAQKPPRVRGKSHLLVLCKKSQQIQDRRYADIIEYLRPGDVLVLNNTKVIPARIITHFADGRQRELMLTESHGGASSTKQAPMLYRGKLRAGDVLQVGSDKLTVVEILGGGQAIVAGERALIDIVNEYGVAPLPPYIQRKSDHTDKKRYQTIFAQHQGSVAAPTASLNMTEDLLLRCKDIGVEVVYLTLHVGRGTFLPIRDKSVDEHEIHQEYFKIPIETIEQIRKVKQNGRRVFAVGTTVARALEYSADKILGEGMSQISGEADIFIYPGHQFRVVDALITNFHAPESTVIQLTMAFAGEDLLRRAYKHALRSDYSFLSYGDSMLIV